MAHQYPTGAPGYPSQPTVPMYNPYPAGASGYPSQPIVPMYNPAVPFNYSMGSIYPNRMILIGGIPHPNAKRITVNLKCGNDVIAFHFDIRFHHGNDRNVIVRNTKNYDGKWGPEERPIPGASFPFRPDMYFEMIILVEPNCFKVAVNDQHLLEYNHRIQPLHQINSLNVTGDVRLTHVKFQG